MTPRPDHHPVSHDWPRYGGAAGIAFVVLCVAGGFVQGDDPVYTDGSAAIKTWFAEHSSRYLIGYCLVALGLFVYLLFLATLVRVLMNVEGGPLSLVALTSGLLVFVAAQVSAPLDGTLALLEGDVSDELAQVFSAADYYAFSVQSPLSGVLTLATSVVILRNTIWWRPLGWFGLLITAGGIIAGAAPLEQDATGVMTTVGYVTLFAFFAWTIGVSVTLLRSRTGSSDPSSAAR
jgi:hypothetical protein